MKKFLTVLLLFIMSTSIALGDGPQENRNIRRMGKVRWFDSLRAQDFA
jgi:hypothetical protein